MTGVEPSSELGRFAQIPEWVLMAGVSSHAIRVYCYLHFRADRGSGRSYLSRANIAKECGFSTATLDRAIAELKAIGALDVYSRWRRGDEVRHEPFDGADRTSSEFFVRWFQHPEVSPPEQPSPGGPGSGGVRSPVTRPVSSPVTRPVSSPVTTYQEPLIDQEPLRSFSVEPDGSTKKTEPAREDTEPLIQLLHGHASAVAPHSMPKNGNEWRRVARLMVERDGIDPTEALEVLKWAVEDDFWRTNIVSMGKFRSQYDQLKRKRAYALSSGTRFAKPTAEDRMGAGLAAAAGLLASTTTSQKAIME